LLNAPENLGRRIGNILVEAGRSRSGKATRRNGRTNKGGSSNKTFTISCADCFAEVSNTLIYSL
jgi:hypothetical protein